MPVFNDQQKLDILQAVLIRAALQNQHISGSDKRHCLLSHCPPSNPTILSAVLRFRQLLNSLLDIGLGMHHTGWIIRPMDTSLSQAAAYIRDVGTDTSGNPILFPIIWLEAHR
jgi:hypothetical protein